jgi:hypothetical protein
MKHGDPLSPEAFERTFPNASESAIVQNRLAHQKSMKSAQSKTDRPRRPKMFAPPNFTEIRKGDAEHKAKHDRKGERAIHDEIEAYLRLREWYYVHSRMDRATTCAVGTPDFIVLMPARNRPGLFVAIECKLPGNKPTADQDEHLKRILRGGGFSKVCYSSKEAIDWLLELEKL